MSEPYVPKQPPKRPFTATHKRADGLLAMLLNISDGEALYRVQWTDHNKLHENCLSRPKVVFDGLFEPVGAQ